MTLLSKSNKHYPMIPSPEKTAEFIKYKRQSLGLTQKEFAELLGLRDTSERTISGWERGEHTPTKAKFKEIETINVSVPFRKTGKTTFDFIDLFAGIGGMRLPFQELGGKCVFTSEWDKFAKKTYAANYGELPFGDISKIPSEQIPNHDVLLAGFPCQAFSQAGLKRGFADTRGTMFFEIQRILSAKRPKAFLLENVKQLKGHDKGRTLETILSILRGENAPKIPDNIQISDEARQSLQARLNYAVDFRVLKASDFGVPQGRERVYIIGFDRSQLDDKSIDTVLNDIFEDLCSRKSATRLGDIMEKHAETDPKYTISDKLLSGHKRRLEEHKNKGNGFGFSVFNEDSPYCNTISARYYKDGSEILLSQEKLGKNPRKLTPRECARIQGFPENFIVSAVSDAQIYKQFGNSVAVPVVREVAKKIVQTIS